MNIDEHVPLAPFTTLGIGGPARYLAHCTSVEEICEALEWAATRSIPVQVLGGGSNTLFDDQGLDGLVVRVELAGVEFDVGGSKAIVHAAAGQDWDALVQSTIDADLVGLECLSGIPGFVGATPIQNVGAYGQEISNVLTEVDVLDRVSLRQTTFDAQSCEFTYRDSRFKSRDRDRYIVTRATYRLEASARPQIRYPELERQIVEAHIDLDRLAGRGAAQAVRDVVLDLRRSKAMVVDPDDANTRSAGSFFLNPILSQDEYEQTCACWRAFAGEAVPAIPSYPNAESSGGHKVPAAWLVERAGFVRGTTQQGAGVSERHALALVSHSGCERDLSALAKQIQDAVQMAFGIRLHREPVRVTLDGSVLPADDNDPRI
ncbi:MAG: UDP-N-acetylmuramate dehydrogenase [Gemmatimonadetes bacterium]|jgi:UDP-N-acetylmuramate dehydrogenase|nr:UDP-N-acetylmuramate dehydrogenase [Gemmatimonadota bacterium]MBT5056378.1 UDP-N-acetylmuramate dehydrogenase [Gemmatimonadota bacterium]MBT5145148.1 UDP-N-acetylmuramate dehydrogenase [Gemmatimonadota bacterium]MBT5586962.1 UDP-N-acetylmuramate dehydrogenase [Gemmatimonadota bacterium]MBT5965375.1 UDP-N-acetylmuramate dehydrogenase [Gemmatimonadota bacterium]